MFLNFVFNFIILMISFLIKLGRKLFFEKWRILGVCLPLEIASGKIESIVTRTKVERIMYGAPLTRYSRLVPLVVHGSNPFIE